MPPLLASARVVRIAEPRVLQASGEDSSGKIKSVAFDEPNSKLGKNAKGLRVTLEAVWLVCLTHERVEQMLANMTKGRMPKIMRQACSLDHLGVNAQHLCEITLLVDAVLRQAATYLGNLDGVLLPGVKYIGFPRPNDLGNSGQATKGRRVEDPVPVSLEVGPLISLYGAVAAPNPISMSPHGCAILSSDLGPLQAKFGAKLQITPIECQLDGSLNSIGMIAPGDQRVGEAQGVDALVVLPHLIQEFLRTDCRRNCVLENGRHEGGPHP